MATNSSIEWTEATWNPVTGWTMVSPGCKNCYAERLACRLQAMRQPNYRNGFEVTIQANMLDLPMRWKRPRIVFVNSMSDLFHHDVPLQFVLRIFDAMRAADWHTYQILTKRSERLLELSPRLPWRHNIWMGVSVESSAYSFRIDHLRRTKAHVKFLSLEPLLGPLPNLNLREIEGPLGLIRFHLKQCTLSLHSPTIVPEATVFPDGAMARHH